MRLTLKLPKNLAVNELLSRANANGLPLALYRSSEVGTDGQNLQHELSFVGGGAEYFQKHTPGEQVDILQRVVAEAAGRELRVHQASWLIAPANTVEASTYPDQSLYLLDAVPQFQTEISVEFDAAYDRFGSL